MDPDTRQVYAKKAFIQRVWFKMLTFCICSFGVYAFLFSGFNVENEAREVHEDPRNLLKFKLYEINGKIIIQNSLEPAIGHYFMTSYYV